MGYPTIIFFATCGAAVIAAAIIGISLLRRSGRRCPKCGSLRFYVNFCPNCGHQRRTAGQIELYFYEQRNIAEGRHRLRHLTESTGPE